jgi:hypothetical protein
MVVISSGWVEEANKYLSYIKQAGKVESSQPVIIVVTQRLGYPAFTDS